VSLSIIKYHLVLNVLCVTEFDVHYCTWATKLWYA